MSENTKHKKLSALLMGQGIPEFHLITPELITRDIPLLLTDINHELSELEEQLSKKFKQSSSINWDDVMTPLQRIGERLRWSWGVVCHLNGVCNSIEMRKAHTAQQPEVIRFNNRIGQSKKVYQALCDLKKNSSNDLDQTQKRILESELLSMNQRGVGLNGAEKKAFNYNSEKLAELSTTFSNNVLDATKQWSLLLTQRSEVEGLPHRALVSLAAAAQEAGDHHLGNDKDPTADQGPWRLGLDMPRYLPFITYATNRPLRETIYRAFVKRASADQLNNQKIIEEILSIRAEQAKRLGYRNWAELSIANKMASDVDAVEELIEELRKAAFPAAKEELSELQSCASRHGAIEASELAPWDIPFWTERLKQERFSLNQEALRPWFPLTQVLNGLFNLCERLFDIAIEAADGESPVWHEDVRFFKVRDGDGSELAAFYLDPYSRPESKRGGAWMDECLIRCKSEEGKPVLPVAYLICNQTPPAKGTPSLMSFEEVETLFHEFGHGLQHMLTKIDYPQAAGINNVEWDAVELPSQFMENWCIDRSTLMSMAKHWRTGEALPDKEFEKLRLSKTFNEGLATLRQIHFALTDLRLHTQWSKDLGTTPDELRREIATTTTVMQPIPEDQFLCAFSHIFAGGYSAGYYSYKWAEVLSADAFAAFEEVGLDQDEQIKSTGRRFRETVLSQGGSRSPAEVFKSFRGRPAQTNALIKHCGFKAIH